MSGFFVIMARPKTYNSKIHPRVAGWLARHGYDDAQICEAMGIAVSTLHEWKKKYKEFSEALKQDKSFTDSLVEDSLYQRAIGYEYDEIITDESKDKAGKKVTKTRTIKKTALPDVTAQIFWLKNRQRELWRDKIQHEHTGENGGPVQVDVSGFKQKLAEKLKIHDNDSGIQKAKDE